MTEPMEIDQLNTLQQGMSEDVNAIMGSEEQNLNSLSNDIEMNGISTSEESIALDKVSLLQESVDKLALSMFNALRLLPRNLQNEETKEEKKNDILLLAKDVLQMVKQTEILIEELPGLEKTEEEQFEEMVKLQEQCEEEAHTLRQVTEEAEQWINRARSSLRVLSENRLHQV